ncbi:MAG: hypothetical protein U9N57_10985, partial [Pseudomonadota bacterium]|nr:hypothetical protein [Pseudomonadota bacterium]
RNYLAYNFFHATTRTYLFFITNIMFYSNSKQMSRWSYLEAAIYEGATIVRIGTDIFGARDYSKA